MTLHGSWTVDRLVEAYTQHQRRTRGLRPQTLRNRAWFVRRLVRAALGADPIDPSRLTPADVVAFITSLRHRFSPGSSFIVVPGNQALDTDDLQGLHQLLLFFGQWTQRLLQPWEQRSMRTVRSFFRFLRFQGLCGDVLEAALPTVAHWRLATLPRSLTDQQVEQVFASFDAPTPCRQRDQTIVQCLSTLGLRPGEVAGLCLDDIDWRNGTIQIRARKNRRGAVLPLPRVVGQALVAYLSGERPPTDERRVFVQHLGARRGEPLSSPAVSAVVVRVLRRAAVDTPLTGPYVFRHTVASRMVREGASLKEVADVLGHRSLNTTTIYAKLDLPRLREVALPWPEVLR